MLKVAVIVIPEAFPHSVIEPFDVLSRGKAIYQCRTGQNDAFRSQVSLIAECKDTQVEYNNIRICPTDDINTREQFDLIWIPSLVIDKNLSYKKRKNIIGWIKHQANNGAEIASICTGSFLLAETGLLNYQSITMHWSFTSLFSENYPSVFVKPQLPTLYNNKVYSAAADAEWLTVVKDILEKYYGKSFSAKTAEMLSFNAMRYKHHSPPNLTACEQSYDAIVEKTQTWLTAHISETNLISRAANEFGLSESSLTRRFKSARKVSVIKFIQGIRVERAKDALELTNMPIEQISDLVGYRDSSYFRRLFKTKTGMTPKEYRKQYAC